MASQELEQRVVRGPVDRRRRETHEHRVVAHAVDTGLAGAGNHSHGDEDGPGRVDATGPDQLPALRSSSKVSTARVQARAGVGLPRTMEQDLLLAADSDPDRG